jgi:hypothetical protein
MVAPGVVVGPEGAVDVAGGVVKPGGFEAGGGGGGATSTGGGGHGHVGGLPGVGSLNE